MDRNQVLNDPETAMRYALQGLQAQMWTAFPGIVQSVDLAAMTVEVVSAIKGVATDSSGVQSYVTMPVMTDVPIVFPSAGGFSLTLPIKSGDEVLVIVSCRCIDAWWQSGGIQQPMELRMHDLSDGFAIPGPRSQPNVITGVSSDNARLVSDDGSVYLEITPGGAINMKAPSGVTITGDLNVTGEVTAKSATTAIPLSAHLHPGVTSGGSNTGGPIP